VPGADEEFQRGVERVDHVYVARQCGRVGDGAERGVDVAGLEGHQVEVGLGMGPPIVMQDDGLRAPEADDVDPEGP
jgi:hypothetical protein